MGKASRIDSEDEVVMLLGVVWYVHLLNVFVLVLGAFLILLILIQRGKGGGLAGAFGGAGGSSAFGSRAGDTFTRVTIIVAAVWILLVMILIKIVPQPSASQTAGTVSQQQLPDETP